MKNILVINVNWLGDVIFSSPVFKVLKAAYPQARITCMAPPRVREALEGIPGVDEVLIYDEKGKHKTPWGKLQLIAQLRQGQFDVAFILHRSLTRALLVFLAGIPARVGYDTKGRGFLLTHKIKPLAGAPHRQDHYLNILEGFGISVTDRACELSVINQARDEVDKILQQNGIAQGDRFVVVNPGGNWPLKRWATRNFAQLIDRLAEDLHVKVVIPGAPKDVPLAEEIAAMTTAKPIILAGQTPLKNLFALMQKADVVISNDSGPLHVANSVGTDVVGLFGPTRPEITGPRGKGKAVIVQRDVGCNRAPCYFEQCPDRACMRSITVSDVINAVKECKH